MFDSQSPAKGRSPHPPSPLKGHSPSGRPRPPNLALSNLTPTTSPPIKLISPTNSSPSPAKRKRVTVAAPDSSPPPEPALEERKEGESEVREDASPTVPSQAASPKSSAGGTTTTLISKSGSFGRSPLIFSNPGRRFPDQPQHPLARMNSSVGSVSSALSMSLKSQANSQSFSFVELSPMKFKIRQDPLVRFPLNRANGYTDDVKQVLKMVARSTTMMVRRVSALMRGTRLTQRKWREYLVVRKAVLDKAILQWEQREARIAQARGIITGSSQERGQLGVPAPLPSIRFRRRSSSRKGIPGGAPSYAAPTMGSLAQHTSTSIPSPSDPIAPPTAATTAAVAAQSAQRRIRSKSLEQNTLLTQIKQMQSEAAPKDPRESQAVTLAPSTALPADESMRTPLTSVYSSTQQQGPTYLQHLREEKDANLETAVAVMWDNFLNCMVPREVKMKHLVDLMVHQRKEWFISKYEPWCKSEELYEKLRGRKWRERRSHRASPQKERSESDFFAKLKAAQNQGGRQPQTRAPDTYNWDGDVVETEPPTPEAKAPISHEHTPPPKFVFVLTEASIVRMIAEVAKSEKHRASQQALLAQQPPLLSPPSLNDSDGDALVLSEGGPAVEPVPKAVPQEAQPEDPSPLRLSIDRAATAPPGHALGQCTPANGAETGSSTGAGMGEESDSRRVSDQLSSACTPHLPPSSIFSALGDRRPSPPDSMVGGSLDLSSEDSRPESPWALLKPANQKLHSDDEQKALEEVGLPLKGNWPVLPAELNIIEELEALARKCRRAQAAAAKENLPPGDATSEIGEEEGEGPSRGEETSPVPEESELEREDEEDGSKTDTKEVAPTQPTEPEARPRRRPRVQKNAFPPNWVQDRSPKEPPWWTAPRGHSQNSQKREPRGRREAHAKQPVSLRNHFPPRSIPAMKATDLITPSRPSALNVAAPIHRRAGPPVDSMCLITNSHAEPPSEMGEGTHHKTSMVDHLQRSRREEMLTFTLETQLRDFIEQQREFRKEQMTYDKLQNELQAERTRRAENELSSSRGRRMTGSFEEPLEEVVMRRFTMDGIKLLYKPKGRVCLSPKRSSRFPAPEPPSLPALPIELVRSMGQSLVNQASARVRSGAIRDKGENLEEVVRVPMSGFLSARGATHDRATNSRADALTERLMRDVDVATGSRKTWSRAAQPPFTSRKPFQF